MDDKTIFIGLGSNLGNRGKNLKKARKYIAEIGEIKKESTIIETEPWGVDTEKSFLNQVLMLEGNSFTGPGKLLAELLEMEKKIGRDRSLQAPDRIIDIDILYMGQMVRADNDPVLPHPRLHRRPFVLRSLVEIAPDFVHPVFEETQRSLLAKLQEI